MRGHRRRWVVLASVAASLALAGGMLLGLDDGQDPVAVQTAGETVGGDLPSEPAGPVDSGSAEPADAVAPATTAPGLTTTSGGGTVVAAKRPKPASPSTTTTTRRVPTPHPTAPPLPVTTLPPSGGVIQPTEPPSAFERDPSFGTGGLYKSDIGGSFDRVSSIVRQPDGKLLVGGDGYVGAHVKVKVLRLSTDGTPDPSFGDDGWFTWGTPEGNHILDSLTLQPDGKVLVAANVGYAGYGGVLRLDRDGHLDGSFGVDGVLDTNQTGTRRVLVLPDGKLVVVGTESTPMTQSDVSIARFTPNGQEDPAFGDGGRTVVDLGSTESQSWWDSPADAARLDDGSFLIVGSHSTSSPNCCPGSTALVMRFTADGDLDEDFGDGGYRTFAFDKNVFGVAVLPDSGGRAVIGVHVANSVQHLLRLGPDGQLDPTFGDGGITRFTAGSFGALTRDGAGRLVIVSFGASYEVRRFTADGRPDASFGGSYRSDIDRYNEFPYAVLVQPDGRIVIAGYSYRDLTLDSLGQYDADWFVERIAPKAA